MSAAPFIQCDERDKIVSLLKRLPLPVVKEMTGRPYSTLAKIAQASL